MVLPGAAHKDMNTIQPWCDPFLYWVVTCQIYQRRLGFFIFSINQIFITARLFTCQDQDQATACWSSEQSCQTWNPKIYWILSWYICSIWMLIRLEIRKAAVVERNAWPPVWAPEHLLLLTLLCEVHCWSAKCSPVHSLLCYLPFNIG